MRASHYRKCIDVFKRLHYYERLLIHKFIDLLRIYYIVRFYYYTIHTFTRWYSCIHSFFISFAIFAVGSLLRFGIYLLFWSFLFHWTLRNRYCIGSRARSQRSLTTKNIIFSTLGKMKLLALVVCNYDHEKPTYTRNLYKEHFRTKRKNWKQRWNTLNSHSLQILCVIFFRL